MSSRPQSPGSGSPRQQQQQQLEQQQQREKNDRDRVRAFLKDWNLLQYYGIFIQEGFDRLEALFEVTEFDLVQMNVKRGHRRLLQRAIANTRGVPRSMPVMLNTIATSPFEGTRVPRLPSETMAPSTTAVPPSMTQKSGTRRASVFGTTTTTTTVPSGGNQTSSMSSAEEDAGTTTSENAGRQWKRKYQRHAKADTNAPVKPPSAYVMFSNDLRAELRHRNLSFAEFAKVAGDRWKNLDPQEKESYERTAQQAKYEYDIALARYEQTEEYRQYQQYVANFREMHEAADRPVGKPRKRIHRDQGAANSPLPTLLPAIRQLSPSSENAGPSSTPLPSRNRNYPYWLLNETPAHIASPSLTGSSESSTVALLNDQDQSPLTGPSSAQDGFDNDNNQPS